MKQPLLKGTNREMAFRAARGPFHPMDPAHDLTRIQGGNWQMQGFRRTAHAYDESECQMSIAEFMADTQERHDIVE